VSASAHVPPQPRSAPQELLDTPNDKSPAQSDAYIIFTTQLPEYRKRVRKQAEKYPPPS
jgi:ubiquitin-conjugating enzyme E2 I